MSNEPATPEYSVRSYDSMMSRESELRSLSSLGLPYQHEEDKMDITSTPPTIDIDAVGYSDSDGREHNAGVYSSALELELHLGKPRLRRKVSPLASVSTPGKKPRRKSRTSEAASDKSHRSEYQTGSGYTLTPATGKIFRNLLILEESLRQQVIQQRALRRKYLAFLAVLCSLIASISHHLYFNHHSGALRVILQFTLLALLVTLMLYHLSGEYQKTIVLPRKFLSSTNKGLRQLNVRLVKIKTSLTDSTVDLIREFGLFLTTMCLKSMHTVYPSSVQNPSSKLEVWFVSGQLQCQPRFGLTDVKLMLMPRSFNTDIREGWELYRNEFWVNEGMRRRNAIMSFAQRPSEEKKSVRKAPTKERRRRKLSTATQGLLSEENLQALGTLSPESITPVHSNSI